MSRKFTRVLVKKSRQRQLGKITVVKAGAYIVSMDKKRTVYGLEAGKIAFLKNAYKLAIATRFSMIQCKPPVTCWCNNLSLAGKRPAQIELPLTQIQYLRKVPGFPSVGHKCTCTCTCMHMYMYPKPER